MNKDPDEAFVLMDSMIEDLDVIEGVDIVICPPFTSMQTLSDMFDGTSLLLGAQNMHWHDKGAYTGEISPLMLKGRCEYVILGHSERRQFFHETDDVVRKKVEAALQHEICPIICVGENLEQYESDETYSVIERQVVAALDGLPMDYALKCVIAYEPIWAIGTGRAATAEGANKVIGEIRRLARNMHGSTVANEMRIQYGGSVTAANIEELASQPEIDGALVGGASLDPNAFVRIVAATQSAARKS
jgi:triosephosphate isomerase